MESCRAPAADQLEMNSSHSMEMYEDEELPDTLEWYKDQIAGHHPSVVKNGIRQIGIVKEHGREEYILKLMQDGVRGHSEVEFYDAIFDAAITDHSEEQRHELRKIKPLVPKYFGKRLIMIASRSYEFIELEDITHPFKKPCIMDIKIGQITFDPNASVEKQRSESVKCALQKEFGFRILGYRLHPDDKGETRTQDKNWGRTRTRENIQCAFEEYLQAVPSEDAKSQIVQTFLEKLSKVISWFSTQQRVQLYSSSLLFVYEGSTDEEVHADVKMIDFSHVFYEPKRDENYIHGLHFIAKLFASIQQNMKH